MKTFACLLISLSLLITLTAQAAPRTARRATPTPVAQDTPAPAEPAVLTACAMVGSYAWHVANNRDLGSSLTGALRRLQSVTPASDAKRAETLLAQSIIMTVYEKRWWTPDYARQEIEKDCIALHGGITALHDNALQNSR